ncbi:uncharacterized protein LOC142325568 [Lycorma delicatula]|uniref:uncharacterized protein LOC142325568 n=1 Tax=Lycorma delicatula TaxID=130591 RepID=UPI003F5177A3
MNPKDIVANLCSSRKLDRDNAVSDLDKLLLTCSPQERVALETELLKLLNNSHNSWETKQGCLAGAKSLIPFVDHDNDKESEFLLQMKVIAEKLLTDTEIRVRTEAGAVLGVLCQKLGPEVYKDVRDYVIELIQSNLERQIRDDEASYLEQKETEKLMEKLTQRRNSSEIVQKFHETAGWKNLETSMLCLQSMVQGCGSNFQIFIDHELLSLIFQTLVHPNRFVRETGFYLCSSLVRCGGTDLDMEERDMAGDINPVFSFGRKFSEHLSNGLADSWSQVRLAASHASRNFIITLPETAREHFYPELLPRICLNRYYIAEGVRIYSQETWRQVTGERGKELVQKYIEAFVNYYQEATLSDNHAVREAACSCIAELATKVDSKFVKPYVCSLLSTLHTCFKDDSWAVRDAACLACGNFIVTYPMESQSAMESLYPLFFNNLGDSIPSVRQGAASALTNVVKAYSSPALCIILETINKFLKEISTQPKEAVEEFRDSCHYNSVKRRRDSDPQMLSDNQFYGSIAQKLGRRCSTSNPSFHRDSQPWERADGAVIFLAEVSEIKEAHSSVMQALPLVAEACRYQDYNQHVIFLETVCRHLPTFVKNLGAKQFKTKLDLFIDTLFTALTCENSLTSSAASQCLNQLGSIIGINILRARVNNHNPRYIEHLDANVFIAPF